MNKTPGTVHDIRSGRAVSKTSSITDKFLMHIKFMVDSEKEFYVVSGVCRHEEVRSCVDELRKMELTVVFDRKMGADKLWLFEGKPEELGFRYAS